MNRKQIFNIKKSERDTMWQREGQRENILQMMVKTLWLIIPTSVLTLKSNYVVQT